MGVRVGVGTGVGPVRVSASKRIGGRKKDSSGVFPAIIAVLLVVGVVIKGCEWLWHLI